MKLNKSESDQKWLKGAVAIINTDQSKNWSKVKMIKSKTDQQ